MNALRFLFGLALVGTAAATAIASPQGDLDVFMQQVVARRDDNWKKLQQYVLDERETFELRGPAGVALWGEQRDYTWYVRDGFFVRSPLKVNGATVGDDDRRKYEGQFLRHEIERDTRARGRAGQTTTSPLPTLDDSPRDVDGLIRQTSQPQFISSAYLLRFRFDQGRYALVGRERLSNREVLRIEYYPTKLFNEDIERQRRRERERGQPDGKSDPANDAAMVRLMNKTSKVTLWIEQESHQILKYTFDDLGWDFFPGSWLVRVSNVTASMTMGQAFPDVWLPTSLVMDIGMTLAVGPVDLRYALAYHDYRQPDVSSKVGLPGGR